MVSLICDTGHLFILTVTNAGLRKVLSWINIKIPIMRGRI